MKKRILSLVLTLTMLASMCVMPLGVSAENNPNRYSFKLYYHNSEVEEECLEIIGSSSYRVDNSTDYILDDTIFINNTCTIRAINDKGISIKRVADNISLEESFVGNTWEIASIGETITISDFNFYKEQGIEQIKETELKNGTYILQAYEFGALESLPFRVVVGNGVFEEEVSVYLNDKKIEFDVPPVIEDGRTLVPLRAIFEAMGMTVGWDGATSTITATGQGNTISMRINDTKATVNGKTLTMDVPSKIIDVRTLVPVRFIAESLGAKVDWDEENRVVTIQYDMFDLVKEVNTLSYTSLIKTDYSFQTWYDWCVRSIANKDATWATASVIKFWQDPKEYVLKEAKDTIDPEKAYQDYYTAILTDALLSQNSGYMLQEEFESEQIKIVAKTYIDLTTTILEKTVDWGIAENKAELEVLKTELWEIVSNPDFIGKRDELSKIEKDFDRILGRINENKLDGADLQGAKKILDGFGVTMDIAAVGYKAYKEVASIKALQNVKLRYINGIRAIRDKTNDTYLKEAADNLMGIMNQSFNESIAVVLDSAGSAFLSSDLAESIAVNLLKNGAEKVLTIIFKMGAKEAAALVSDSFGIVGAGITAGKITTAVCDVVAGTSTSVNASMDLKMTMAIKQSIGSIISNEFIANGSDLSECSKEFAGMCEVQKAVMAHASCLTNKIYNAQDNSGYDKVIRLIMDKEVYDDTHDRVTMRELDKIRMIKFICTE